MDGSPLRRAAIILFLLPLATAWSQASQPATTQVLERGTPAGAMRAYEHALDINDAALVADSFNMAEGTKQALAAQIVAEHRFVEAVDHRLGKEKADAVCRECGVRVARTGNSYADEMWTISPKTPDEAIPNREPGKPPTGGSYMQRGADGVWRMGRFARGRQATTIPANDRRLDPFNKTTRRIEPIIPRIESGELATADAIIAAVYPEGSPEAKLRQAEQQAKKDQEDHAKQEEADLLAAHFDQATVSGTIGMIVQAFHKHDPAAAARGYFLKDAVNDRFVLATTRRLDVAFRFFDAAGNHHVGNGEELARQFGLFVESKFAFYSPFARAQERGDDAVVVYGSEDAPIWFHKADGRWRQQLVTPSGQPLDEATENIELDAAAVEKIISEIERDTYKTEPEMRDALGAAMLNSFSDPTCTIDFQPRAYRPGEQNKTVEHRKPQPLGSQSADPKTPAGAMNRFIRGVQNGDEEAVAASLWQVNDRDGAAAAALAHDYIVGAKFLAAAQAKEPPDERGRYIYSDYGVIGPDSLRDYTEDEWKTLPDKPDLAISAGSLVGKPEPGPGAPDAVLMHHTWTPIMHRGGDGVWRIGPYYPQNARQLGQQSRRLAAKDQILDQATADLSSGKSTIEQLYESVAPRLKALGVQPVATEE